MLEFFRWRAANFDLCSALMATEQWGFFCVPHLLSSVYNGHLRGLVTLTPNAVRLQFSCHYHLGLSRLGFEYLTFHMRGERALNHCGRGCMYYCIVTKDTKHLLYSLKVKGGGMLIFLRRQWMKRFKLKRP